MSRAGDFLNEADFDSEDMGVLRDRMQDREKLEQGAEALGPVPPHVSIWDTIAEDMAEDMIGMFDRLVGAVDDDSMAMQVPICLNALIQACEELVEWDESDEPGYEAILDQQITVLNKALDSVNKIAKADMQRRGLNS